MTEELNREVERLKRRLDAAERELRILKDWRRAHEKTIKG